VSLRPVKHVIVKTEYQWLNNRAHSEITQSPGLVSVGQYPLTGIHEWNLGLGYEF
jgi:hypothetical protein